jgi:hypothetical protein
LSQPSASETAWEDEKALVHIPFVAPRVLLLQVIARGMQNGAIPAKVMDLDGLGLLEERSSLTKWNFGGSHN